MEDAIECGRLFLNHVVEYKLFRPQVNRVV